MSDHQIADEPDYVVQTAEPDHMANLQAWFEARVAEAKAEGITFARYSVDSAKQPTMALIEGWKCQPRDQGEQRWAVLA